MTTWKLKMFELNEENKPIRRMRKNEILELAKDYWDFSMDEGNNNADDYQKLLFYLDSLYTKWSITKMKKQYIGFGISDDSEWIMAVDDEDPSYGVYFLCEDGWTAIPELVINRCLNDTYNFERLVFAK